MCPDACAGVRRNQSRGRQLLKREAQHGDKERMDGNGLEPMDVVHLGGAVRHSAHEH